MRVALLSIINVNNGPLLLILFPAYSRKILSSSSFLDTIIYKGDRFRNDSILDIRTHYKPTETFQYTHFTSCHPPGLKRGFIKGEALRLLRTNSSETMFEDNLSKFKSRLIKRGYPKKHIRRTLSDVNFATSQSILTSQTSILLQDSRLYYKKTKRVNEFCLLSQHTNRQCGTLKKLWCLSGI